MRAKDYLRRVILSPYLPGKGPKFILTLWETGRQHWRGTSMLRYELKQDREVIFTGDDYSPSPMHCDDSDDSIASLLGFLTVKPGDTDRDYFEDYTERQLQFCAEHAEALSVEAIRRFGDS